MQIIINDLGIDIWPIGMIILLITLTILWHRKYAFPYLVCFSLFWIYIMLGLRETFFPIQITGDYVRAMRQMPFTSRVNFKPLYFGQFGLTEGIVVHIIKNVILTMPFGFGVNFIARYKAKEFLGLSVFVGLGIEAIQLFISLLLMYPYRVIDVNDILFNTIGVLIGYGLFRVFAWLFLAMTRQFGIEHAGFSAYIYDMVSQASVSN